jgi:hypothetical protein
VDDDDKALKELEARIDKRLNAMWASLASAPKVGAAFGELERRVEALERKLGEVEGDREALPSDIPKPL